MTDFRKYLPSIVLLLVIIFFVYDIVVDFSEGLDSYGHTLVELLVFVTVSWVLFYELQHVKLLSLEVDKEKLKTARLAGELYSVMQAQFIQWKLSPSESQVGLLLIKGLSMKEIAQARNVKEKTVRLQASSIYGKSGYTGRHELAAHFIEDLMGDL